LIQLITTGKVCVGALPAQAGLPFEVETEAQAERFVAKGYATLAGAPEEPQEEPVKPKRTKKGE
jgi:hypothetical protein